MNSQSFLGQLPEDTTKNVAITEDANDTQESDSHASDSPPRTTSRILKGFTPFWHNRIIEAALVLSMALYYVIGNTNLGTGQLFQLNPLISLPFLLIFGVLCWYRLPFAVALIPLGLPYYLQQKTVISHYSFSIVEIALLTCVAVALVQFLQQRGNWRYYLSWRELRDRLGPFALPILVFIIAAGLSLFLLYLQKVGLPAFPEGGFPPVFYVLPPVFFFLTRP